MTPVLESMDALAQSNRREIMYNPSGYGARLVYGPASRLAYGYHDKGERFVVLDVDIVAAPTLFVQVNGQPFIIADGRVVEEIIVTDVTESILSEPVLSADELAPPEVLAEPEPEPEPVTPEPELVGDTQKTAVVKRRGRKAARGGL